VAVKWFLPETHSENALTLLKPQNRFIVPDRFWLEIANVLLSHIRRKILSKEDGTSIWRKCLRADLIYTSDMDYVDKAFQTALETGSSVYDSLFLAVALGNECHLVTADRKFYNSLQYTPYSKNIIWVGELS